MRAAEPNSLDAGLLYVGVGPAGTARRAQPFFFYGIRWIQRRSKAPDLTFHHGPPQHRRADATDVNASKHRIQIHSFQIIIHEFAPQLPRYLGSNSTHFWTHRGYSGLAPQSHSIAVRFPGARDARAAESTARRNPSRAEAPHQSPWVQSVPPTFRSTPSIFPPHLIEAKGQRKTPCAIRPPPPGVQGETRAPKTCAH